MGLFDLFRRGRKKGPEAARDLSLPEQENGGRQAPVDIPEIARIWEEASRKKQQKLRREGKNGNRKTTGDLEAAKERLTILDAPPIDRLNGNGPLSPTPAINPVPAGDEETVAPLPDEPPETPEHSETVADFAPEPEAEPDTDGILLSVPGSLTCTVCGTAFGFDSEDGDRSGQGRPVKGLTCTACGRSYCLQHLNQPIPDSFPGGKCPFCDAPMGPG